MKQQSSIKLTVCATALAIAFPVIAQDQPDNSNGITEVIITASKRKESIQSVPMSVDAVTGDTLRKMNVTQFSDVEKLSPGLVLNASDGRGQNVALRGVTFDPDTAASPTVQIYWNETPIGSSDAFRGLFDIGRIEVLRGPQGTLRGQTSPAGAITVATRQPSLNGLEGTVSQTIGARSMWNTQAAVNVPLIEGKLALRVAGLYDRSEDGVHNVVNGRDNSRRARAGRASLLYQPFKELEILLVHQQLSDRSVNYPVAVGEPVPGQAPGPSLEGDDYASVVEGGYDFYNLAKLTSLNATWTAQNHKLSYIGGFQQRRETGDRDIDSTNVIQGYRYAQQVRQKGKQNTHEIRIESTDNPFWNYMVGGYYSKNRNVSQVRQPVNYLFSAPYTPPLFTFLDGFGSPRNFSKSTALFTDHRFELTPNDNFEAGVRVQKNQSYTQQYITVFGSQSSALPDDKAMQDSKRWTGSASYKHTFTKDLMAYVSYAGGYRPGGAALFVTSKVDPNILLYKPETSNSFEIGLKSKLLNRKLTLNVDVFQQKLKNYIARANTIWARPSAVVGEPAGPGPGGTYPGDASTGGLNFNTNGDVISRGLEATAIYSIVPNWQAQLSLSYVDAHYNNALLYCNDSNNDGIPDSNGAFVQPGRQVSVCKSNRPLADSLGNEPGRLNMTLQSEYSRAIGNVEAFARGLVRYVPPSYNLERKQDISSFTPVDLFIGVRDPGHKWELSLWSQNLFNRVLVRPGPAYYVGGYAGGYSQVRVTDQRKYGVTLRYDFDS